MPRSTSQNFCCQRPCPCGEPQPSPASAGGPPTLADHHGAPRRVPCAIHHVADRVLVLRPGVRPEPLRCESRVQDTGPPETSQIHVISNGESSPRDLHLNTNSQFHSTTSKLQCWTRCAKQLARQEHNPTH